MKRMMVFALSLFTLLGSAWADKLTATDVAIQQGRTAVLNVGLTNPDTEYAGFQFKLVLPEGITATAIEKGERIADLDVSIGLEGNQVLAFYLVNVQPTALPGTSGTVAGVTLQADASLAAGSYTGKLTEVQVSDLYNESFDLDDVTFIITVSEPQVTVLDETSTTVPAATDDAVELLVKRTIKANTWSTICLPFDMTEEQVKAAFGKSVQLAEFTDYEAEYDDADNVTAITVNFDDTDLSEGLYANYPYLIKVTDPVTEFSVTAKVEPDEENAIAEYDNGKTGKNRKVFGTFRGVMHSGTNVPANDLFLSDNKFYYSTGNSPIKAFRAYLNLVEMMPSSSSSIGIRINDGTTHVEGLDATDKGGKAYDLSGRRIQSGKNLERGIYIVDGKKVVIK